MNHTLTRYLYPSIIVLVILIIIAVFAFSATFITKSIDAALQQEQENQAQELAIRMQSYDLAAKKLSLRSEVSSTVSETMTVPSSTITTSTIIDVPAPEDKNMISIAVLNSTGISGKAGALAKAISSAGFTIRYTGNAAKRESTTLLQVKPTSKKIFPESLKEISKIIGTQYAVSETTLEENSEYDIVIIIGFN